MNEKQKYFVPVGLLCSLYCFSIGFYFFFEGAQVPAAIIFATATISAMIVIFDGRFRLKKYYRLSFLISIHIGFLCASIISGGLYSPLIWVQLILSPMAYQFLSLKKQANFLTVLILLDFFLLFIWQKFLQLPTNHMSGPANPVIQFVSIFSVASYFGLQGLFKVKAS